MTIRYVIVLTAIVAGLVVGASSPASAVPEPSVTIDPDPVEGMLGSQVTVSISFDNTGTDPGFGPYIDLRLPAGGADGDDGITFVSATYLGVPVSSTVIDCPDGGGTVTHPLTGLDVDCPDGQQLVVLQVPFGSFAPDQPPAPIEVTFDVSPNADIDAPLDYTVTPGFIFGDSPTGTPQEGEPTTGTFVPVPGTFEKQYLGPEDETATGPNYPRTYRLVGDIADGQTVTDATVADLLPPNLAFLEVTSVTPGSGVVVTEPPSGVPSLAPDNELSVTFDSVTGTASAEDLVVEFTAFVPDVDANGDPVLDPASGAPAPVRDDGSVSGTFVPLDPRDPEVPFTIDPEDPAEDDHILTARSVAVQKYAAPLSADGTVEPGAQVEYTLRVEVSDFFSFDPVVLDDVLGDGLAVDPATATFTVSEHDVVTTGTFTPGVDLTIDESQHACGDGSTGLSFDLSAALQSPSPGGGLPEGRLDGGLVGGTFGPTVAEVTFTATILDAYRCATGGEPALDPGDPLTNDVTISGDVLDPDTGTPTGGTPTDGSSAELVVEEPVIEKTVYARNGELIDPADGIPQFVPGDEITFRFQFPFGSTDMEQLVFTDYFPLPAIQVAGDPTYLDEVCGIPAPNTACLGPDDTFHTTPQAVVPTLTADTGNNSVTGDFGTFANPENPATLMDTVMTMTIEDEPFRDGLLLVNQLQASWTTTDGETRTATDVAEFQVLGPALNVTKGVVGSTNPNTTFTGGPQQPTAGGTFAGPVVADCADSIEGGIINSADLGGAPDADADGVDAGDTVRFAMVVENTGSGLDGAFDVVVGDTLPEGFQVPDGGLNLCVTDGTGAEFDFTGDGMFTAADGTAGPLAGTIALDDPGPTAVAEGALDPPVADLSSGRNLVVISYELEATDDLIALGDATNTATIDNYASNEGGADYVPVAIPSDVTDDAVVTATAPDVDKSVVATDQDHSTGTNVAVGETVQYEVVVTVPEGVLPDATLVDTLPAGLAVVSVDDVTATDGLETSVPGGFDAVADAAQDGLAAPGDTVTFDFDTLTDTDRDDGVTEQITLTYTVIVLDVEGNQQGTGLPNSAVLSFAGESLPPASASVTVAEPDLTVTKTVSPTSADANDTVTYTVQVAHSGASTLDAFDIELSDVVPDAETYVPGSLTAVSGPTPTLSDAGAPTLTASWDELPLGEVAEISYQAVLDADLAAPNVIDNTATATWTSLPDDTDPTSPFNPAGVERTGEGGVDDYTASDTAEIQVLGLLFEKAVNSTSEPDTVDPAVTIGEQVTYDIQVAPAEGVITDLTVTDAVPTGLLVDPASVQVLTAAGEGTPPFALEADFNGTLPTPTVTGGAADGEDVVVTFAGTTTVDPDNDPTNNAFVVRLTGTVLDVPSNVGLPPDQTVLENEATVSAAGTPPLATSTVANPVVEPRLAIGKEVDPTSAVQGDTVTLTIDVTNTGTSTAYGVLVEDQLPPEYVATSVVEVTTPTGFTFSQTGSLLSYQGGDIPAGETVTFVVTAALDPDLVAGTVVTNTATASDATSLPDVVDGERTVPDVSADASLNVVAPDLVLTKTDNDVVVAPGDTQVYELTVRNAGGAPASGIVITDTLPPNTTFVAVGGADCSGAAAGSTVTIDVGLVLAPGASVTCTLTVTIDDPLPAGVTAFENTATVVDDGAGGPDPTPANNAAVDVDTKDPAATPDLSVAKDDGETEVAPGQELTYTVTATNNGTVGATNVRVADTIPTNTTFVACTTPTGTVTVPCAYDAATGQVTATYSPVAGGGGTATLEIEVLVNDPLPSAVTEITNTVTVDDDGANGPDPTPEDNTDTDTDTVDASPDMSIVKVPETTLVVPGQTYGYDLTVANGGDQDATGVTVTDTVPDGLTVDCATVTPAAPALTSCDSATGEIVWGPPVAPDGTATDPWPAGETATFSYDVTVDDPAAAGTTSFTNTATVADDGANGIDPTPENNESDATTDLDVGPDGAQPDLSVTKDDGVETAAPGDTLTYAVTVTNSGNIGATNVVVTDTLPTGTTFVSCATPTGTVTVPCAFDPATGEVAVTYSPVEGGGGTATMTVTVTVDDPQPAGVEELTNTVTVTDDGENGPEPTPDDNTDTDTDELEATPDLDVTKNDGIQIRTAGEQYTYTLTVRNKGDQEATGVVVTDQLPAGTTFVSCDPACTDSGSTVTWDIPSMPGGADATPPVAGSSTVLTVTVQVEDPLPAGLLALRNNVNVADDGTNGPDPTPADNIDNDVDLLVAGPDLAVTKDDGVDTVAPGDTVPYTLTVTNNGTQASTGVVVTDTLPAGLTFVSCDPACDSSGLPVVTWDVDEAPVGYSETFEVVATVDDPAAAGLDEVTNLATVDDDGTNGPDRNPDDNTHTDTDTVDAVPDLVVAKDDGVDRVEGGDTVTYTVTVENVGDQDASGVVVRDTLPDGMTFVSCAATPDPIVCAETAPGSGVVEADIPLLAGEGGQVELSITVTVDDPVADGTVEFENAAIAEDDGGNGPDPTPDDNTDTDTDTYGADLSVVKDDGVDTVTPGASVTYTITVTNNGPSDVDSLVLTDAAPSELTDLAFTPSEGDYDPATGEWTGLDLAPGDSVTMELAASVDPGATGELTNTATVELPEGFTDPTPDNNTSSDTDTLTPATDITVEKDGPESAQQGDLVTYAIVVANAGPSSAAGIVVDDATPAGLEFVSASGDGWTCAPAAPASCSLDAPLAPDATATVEVTFRVTTDSATIVNVAVVSDPTCGSPCDQDDARTAVPATPDGGGGDDTGGGGALPFTGSDVWRLLAAAALALAVGLAARALSRRYRGTA